jgi:hypothetical protein
VEKEGGMQSLRITQAKPNPTGKDRARSYVPNSQLNGEWVDLHNDGTEGFPLERIELNDVAFQPGCKDPKWRGYQTFTGTLAVGKVLRVHAGHKPEPPEFLAPIDATGADFHIFTGTNYVFNNDCGDTIGLWDRTAKTFEDKASYDPKPPEGRILKRMGDKLVP